MKHVTVVVVLFVCSLAAAQSRVLSGTVANGTTHKAASGDDVILLKLGQGMEEEARTKTDARGEFKFNITGGNAPRLIRVRHDNVNYHEPVQPNADRVQITVYNAVAKAPGLKLVDQSEIYQSDGTQLQVIELFRVNNAALPALTQPSFEFYLPEGASIKLGRAVSENGMPVTSAVVPQKEKNKYAFLHPLRPGLTQLELAYTMPYSGKVSLQPKFAMATDHFYVVTAKGIQFAGGSGVPFQAAGQWPVDPSVTGVEIHAAEGVSPVKQLSFELSGSGLIAEPQAAAPAQGQGAPQAQEDNRPGGGLGVPNEKPDPLHSSQWLFLAVLGLFLAAGAIYVYTSSQPAADPVKKPPAGPGLLMAAMKEEIFQLESERLQGRISSQEYESAKAALDKTLQRAVQRQKGR